MFLAFVLNNESHRAQGYLVCAGSGEGYVVISSEKTYCVVILCLLDQILLDVGQ